MENVIVAGLSEECSCCGALLEGRRLICAHRFDSSAHTHFVSTCASSAHTDLTHARTQSIGETQVRTQAISRMFAHLKMEWPLPPLNFTPAHKRVSQVEMATSFFKFYPRVAHQRVSQLGMTTSFSKFYPCLAHKRVSQVEMATSFSKFYPRVAHQRVSQLGRATSFSKFYPCMAHKRVSQVEMATSFSKFPPAWPTKG